MTRKEYTNGVQKNSEKGDILKVQLTKKNIVLKKYKNTEHNIVSI